jgi:glucosamine-6-phosphate deaminase
MNRLPTIFANADKLGHAVAEEIVHGMAMASRDGKRYLLGVPSGRTPRSTYRALASIIAGRSDLDLSRFHIVMMDDYVVQDRATGLHSRVSTELPYSCERFGRLEILGAINATAPGQPIPQENLWLPDPASPEEYDRRIEASGGLDVFILAMGTSDGHIAFNPAGSPHNSHTRVVDLADQTRHDNMQTFPDFSSLSEVPHQGVTVGIDTIRRFSRRAIMLAIGKNKQSAVSRLLETDEYDPSWPATIVHECANHDIYIDRAALPTALAAR